MPLEEVPVQPAQGAFSESAALRAAVESGLDGLVVVSPDGRMLSMNHQFVDMWQIPPHIVEARDDNAALDTALTRLVDPEGFMARVRELYADPSGPSREELLLKDGRVFDRYGTPLRSPAGDYLGWAWYFRDVTAERRAALEAVQASERFARLARTLQESLLPPHLPDVPGLEIAARYLPGTHGVDVVGDFYDVFQTSAATWAVTIGDVCGKGVEAAKVTALARYTIRAVAVTNSSPAMVLRRLHEAMRRQHPDSERFVTAAYVRLEQHDGKVRATISLAGHPPVLCRRADGRVESLGVLGTVLGVLNEVDLNDSAVDLEPGDALVMFTDGVTEARRGGELYGEDRLRRLLETTSGPAATIAERVEQDVMAYSEGEQADDTAVVVVRVPSL